MHQQHQEKMDDEQIINCQLSLTAKKDFGEEVRALVDVHKFVADSFILTDITQVSIASIVEHIVDKMVSCRNLGGDVAEEAKALLVVDRSSLNMLLSNTMQGLYKSRLDGRIAYDQSWMVVVADLASLSTRQVAIARFSQPVNFGDHSHEIRFLVVVLTPSKEKLTKGAWETGRTFATMFTDKSFRCKLLAAKTQDEFKKELLWRAESLAQESEKRQLELHHTDAYKTQGVLPVNYFQVQSTDERNRSTSVAAGSAGCCGGNMWGSLGAGLTDDIRRRAGFYISDFTDGILGQRSLYKTISTTIFLYFSVLMPCIAFGVVDANNTDGQIDPLKTIIGQSIGGLFFALFSGQPLVIVMTTAPLCVYIKVIYQISQDLDVEFSSFYACVGLWVSFFLILMVLTNMSNLMRYCTRSTEDIFALFTAFAFGSDGLKEAYRSFKKFYWEPDCTAHKIILTSRTLADSAMASSVMGSASSNNLTRSLSSSAKNLTSHIIQATYTTSPLSLGDSHGDHLVAAGSLHNNDIQHNDLAASSRCQRETCILFLFLMSGTIWLANSFYSFNKTPYLSPRKREIIKDYALAISVLIFSFVGSYLFSEIHLDAFEFRDFEGLGFVQLTQLSPLVIAIGALLGFILSILFYIDQNICGAMVNNAPYKLKKGDYFHLDLLVLALLNAFFSLTGLPWMHGKLPHSHLHSKALADYEERVDEGHIHQDIVNVRETRLTGFLCSILIGLTILAVPYPLSYIPLPVLSGVFLYTALSEFKSNSMVERVCLLFTEQAAYPPNHYIRRCPQRKIHLFTATQLFQLAIVTFIGFYPSPYVNMSFPLIIALFVPFRAWLLPSLIEAKYLNSLDSASSE